MKRHLNTLAKLLTCAALLAAVSLPIAASAAPEAKTPAKTAATPATTTPTAAAPAEVDHYTCPMHADVRAAKPGKCPKCGMDLVPVLKKK